MGSIGVSGVRMVKREVLVPVYLHNTEFPRVFLFVSAVCLFFSNEQEWKY